MSSVVAWFRRRLAWSSSRQSWHERLAVAVLLLLAVLLLVLARNWSLSQQIVCWGCLLFALAVVARRGWLRLFGPVLFYDLVRTARRTRFVIVRTLYALMLAIILGWSFFVLSLEHSGIVSLSQMAEFATGFFFTFMIIQFTAVVLLTPPYAAGAIAEEKERKTLEFLLATDLRNREIVLGKLVARLLNLTVLVLAGLPILAFLQFLGGIDPGLLLAGFAATALTMFSSSGWSILSSVLTRRSRDAIVLAYLGLFAYHLLASLALILLTWPAVANFPSAFGWTSPITLGDLIQVFNSGNIGYALVQLSMGSSRLDLILPGILRDYAIFHGLFGGMCICLAVLRLRSVALRETVYLSPRGTRKVTHLPRRLRAIGATPMLWKEIVAEGHLRLNVLGRIITGVLVGASFLPIIIIIYLYFDNPNSFGWGRSNPWVEVSKAINAAQIRFVGTVVGCLLWLAIVVRASGSISGERDRDTLDNLLTTPLPSSEILYAKWLGAILSVRRGWIWLGAIWGIGILTGAVHVLSLPLLIGAWFLYAAVLAGVGLWFSTGARRTLRATVGALLTTLVLLGGHWLVSGMCCFFPLRFLSFSPKFGLHL
jgi:ABC-type transport system involved in multi-copper enzyme maturation permease subunit